MRVKVCVFLRTGRKFYEAQWTNPITGRKETRSTKKATRRDAERVAARIEDEIENGTFQNRERMTWADFRKKYETEVLKPRALKGRQKVVSTLNAIELHVSPLYVSAFDADQVSRFQSKLRAEGLAEATIRGHLSCLRAALRWAARMEIIPRAPTFDMPRGVGGMKGRAPTEEEFDRMLAKASEVVGESLTEEWQFLLKGLWWGGLRLAEAWALHWTDDKELRVQLEGKRPMFRIQAGSEKSRKFRLLPMAPEFAQLLETVPPAQRRGYVFKARNPEELTRPLADWVSKLICRMGKAAGVKVTDKKFASAHDFRRAFGFRWSRRVMPAVLREMMRHASIETTMKYYVGLNAEATADEIWAAFSNKTANTAGNATEPSREARPATH